MKTWWNNLGRFKWPVGIYITLAAVNILLNPNTLPTFIILGVLLYATYKIAQKVSLFGRNQEDYYEPDDDPYHERGLLTRKHIKTRNNQDSKTILTQTEQDLFDALTEDLTGTQYDPPIPLQWSTLNPFRRDPYTKFLKQQNKKNKNNH